ncbi:dipicolinate synthase subunit A [Rhodopseudomonas pseudopalustris]|uniref:Dipicolinate synthase subunit A n=2 Tax=Rhodopseudomonas pseudopalustris TaxID=1513892 RepID=A0A1H8UEI0_9BRAD|nr:dipicolinate synthase subunit A [Rhodopseudomonas pseudopalustris]
MGPAHQEANGRIAVCVVGDGDVVVQLLERLANMGVRVHATADTIDDYSVLERIGAVPHRFEDMPAVAAGIDLLISTSFSRPIGATVLARLPESAVVIDLAGPPGSVDFEVAQRLARRAIWEPPVDGRFDASWRSVADQIEKL